MKILVKYQFTLEQSSTYNEDILKLMTLSIPLVYLLEETDGDNIIWKMKQHLLVRSILLENAADSGDTILVTETYIVGDEKVYRLRNMHKMNYLTNSR